MRVAGPVRGVKWGSPLPRLGGSGLWGGGGGHIGHLFLIRAVILGGEGRGAASTRPADVCADAAQNTPETADALNGSRNDTVPLLDCKINK